MLSSRKAPEAAVVAAPAHRSLGSARIAAMMVLLGLLGEPAAASAASPNGVEFQVNTFTTGYQEFPSVATDSAGDFVVVWQFLGVVSPIPPYPWIYEPHINGQRYDASGSPSGGEFQVESVTTGGAYFRYPKVASDAAG